MIEKVAVFLTLVFTLACVAPATAREAPSAWSDVDGIVGAYGRIYMVDLSIVATPGAVEALAAESDPLLGRAAVYTFEDEEAASKTFDTFADVIATEAMEGAEAGKTEIDDLGDAAFQYVADMPLDSTRTAEMALILVQEGPHVFASAIIGGDEPAELARAWVGHMLDGVIGEEEEAVVPDGTSTGGVFNVMPAAGDGDLLNGLAPIADLDLLEAATSR